MESGPNDGGNVVTLREKQSLFAHLLAQFILWIYDQGYEITHADSHAWADDHRHMKNSVHYDSLAADLNLFKDGVFLPNTESHAPLGAYWKTLNPLCRWGGDFTKPDGNHYSLEDGGRA